VARAPGLPGREHGGHGLEGQRRGRAAREAPGELVPERPALAVEHEPHAALHEAGRREAPRRRARARAGALEGHGRRREAAPDDGDVAPAERVVRDLVPVEPAERVGPRLARERDADHGVVRCEPGVVGGGVGGPGAAFVGLGRRPAPEDLLDAEPLRRRRREEGAERGVDAPEEPALEGVVAGRRPQARSLVPAHPREPVRAEGLAREALEGDHLRVVMAVRDGLHLARPQVLHQHRHEAVVAARDELVEEVRERVASGLEGLVDARLLRGGERLHGRHRERVRLCALPAGHGEEQQRRHSR
jgi:hypothetical protein